MCIRDRQKNFYPDYIISVNGEVWIVETKGGFDRSGNSQDIDIFTPKKFAVLKDYLERYSLKGGIVRYDEKSEELCICMDSDSEDINSCLLYTSFLPWESSPPSPTAPCSQAEECWR